MDIVTVDVGIDYHSSSARVCVMDQEGISLLNRSVESSVDAVIELIQSVAQEVQVSGVALEACTGSAEFAARLHLRTAWRVRLCMPAPSTDSSKDRTRRIMETLGI